MAEETKSTREEESAAEAAEYTVEPIQENYIQLESFPAHKQLTAKVEASVQVPVDTPGKNPWDNLRYAALRAQLEPGLLT